MLLHRLIGAATVFAMLAGGTGRSARAQNGFDHEYRGYASVLRSFLRGDRVDYAAMKADRASLDAVARSLGSVAEQDLRSWTRPQQLAFWINAYNVFTLRAIVDHYPIRGTWFSLSPRNSIRQIDGVWNELQWRVAGRDVTLDDIEHRILRPTYSEPLVHVAINCGSVSCPPLSVDPYRAATLEDQLETAAKRYLASPQGLSIQGDVLAVSSIFKWYGEDFVERYAARGPGSGTTTDRAVRGFVAMFGPPEARTRALSGRTRLRFLPYDWSLNDVAGRR